MILPSLAEHYIISPVWRDCRPGWPIGAIGFTRSYRWAIGNQPSLLPIACYIISGYTGMMLTVDCGLLTVHGVNRQQSTVNSNLLFRC
jgi:hypothetical protein